MTRTSVPHIRLSLCLLAGVLLLSGCGSPPPVEPGQPAPSFELASLTGGTVSSDDLDAKPTVVSFWASWCQPCLKEIPVLNELTEDPSVQVVTIALDDEGAATVAPFVEQHDIRYPVLLGDQETFLRFDGFGIPHTLVLDGERNIVAVHRGPVERETLLSDLGRPTSSAPGSEEKVAALP